LGDAKVLHDLWVKLRREVPEPELAAAVRAALGAYRLPAHLPQGLAEELPEGPGAYRFFGADDVLLYVGRADSLRARVCGQFATDEADSRDRRLADQVRRIDWVPTVGELGAMLKEAQWIQARKPVFNRRAKGDKDPHTLRAGSSAAGRGQHAVEAVAVDRVDPAGLLQCYGMFRSENDARKALTDIARARQLCLKVLGIEEGAGSCFAHQVGKCKGACVGKEPLILHDMRTRLALSSLKLKAWPFPGRIAICERARWGGAAQFASVVEFAPAAELHVVDHWYYLGTARNEEELATLAARGAHASNAGFDVDVYRILARYLSKHPKLDWVDLRDKTICP